MKKIKKIWQENSVLFVLLLILIACLIAIAIVVINYFVGSSSSKYGDRLEGVENYPISESVKSEFVSTLEEDELIQDVTIYLSGKTIYVTIVFDSKTTLVEAQSKALSSLELIDEELLTFYDVEYFIQRDATEDSDGFQIMGTHNVGGTGGIVWNNNTPIKNEEE